MHLTRILAIRHGETDWNTSKRIQGHADIPLNATGQQQADQLARRVAGNECIDAIYSSDLARAAQTAQAIAQRLQLPVASCRNLRERCFGCIQGQTFAEFAHKDPMQAQHWRLRDPDWSAPAGGESLRQLNSRILQAVDQLAGKHIGQSIIIVTHGGVLDILHRAAIGLDLKAARTWQLDNAALNRLIWTPEHGLSLVGWNDTAHLQKAAMDDNTF